jgi:hypothetical protein
VPWFCCVAPCEVLRAKRQFVSRIPLIGPTMARAYKGIDLLIAFESGDFLVWKQMTLAYFARDLPTTHSLLLGEAQAMIEDPDGDGDAAPINLRLTRVRDQVQAVAHIMMFLGPTMRQMYKRARTGADLWVALHADHASWMATEAPLLQKQLDQLGPGHGEGVRAYCDRAGVLALDMADVGRPLDHKFMVDKVLDGLLKERQAWQPVLLGLRGSMRGHETLEEVTGRLAEA